MNKRDFLAALRKGLNGLPENDIDERIAFYGEMIDDRMEDGLAEQEAVSSMGTVEEVISRIVEDTPLLKLVKQKMKPKRKRKTWETVLLIIGSPVWVPLLICAFAIILSLYIVLWAVVICLWAVFVSFAACAAGGIAGGIVSCCMGNGYLGAVLIGAGIIFAGLSILMFFVCRAASKGTAVLAKKIVVWIKNCFVKKEVE